MPSYRFFDGVDDEIAAALGACLHTGAYAYALLVRRPSVPEAVEPYVFFQDSGGTFQHGLYSFGPNITLLTSAGEVEGPEGWFTTAKGWMLITVSKAAGSAKPIWRVYSYDQDETLEEEAATALGNPSSVAGGSIRFATGSGFFGTYDFAAAAFWDEALSKAQFEALRDARGTEDAWEAIGTPSALWTFDQASVTTAITDLTGNGADQTSRTGTTAKTGEVPIPYEGIDAELAERLAALPVLDDFQRTEDPLDAEGDWLPFTDEGWDGDPLYSELVTDPGQVTPTGWTTGAPSTNAGAFRADPIPAVDDWAAGFTIATQPAVPQHVDILIGDQEVWMAFNEGAVQTGLVIANETVKEAALDITSGDDVMAVYWEGTYRLLRRRYKAWAELLSHTAEIAAASRHPGHLFYIGEPPSSSTAVRLTDFVAGSLVTAEVSSSPHPAIRPRTQLRVVSIAQGGEGQGYDITDQIEGLSWSSVNPGGDERCNFTLKRSWFSDSPEIARGNLLRVTNGIDVLWQGRIEETDRGTDSTEKIAVTAYGLGARLKDGTFQEIFVDRDLSAWGEPSTRMRIQRQSSSMRYEGQMSVGSQASGEAAAPGVIFTFTTFDGSYFEMGEAWLFGGGVDIGEVRYDFDQLTSGGLDTTWASVVGLSPEDSYEGAEADIDLGSNHNNQDAANQSLVATKAGRQYAFLWTVYQGVYTGTGQNIHAFLNIRIFGRHGLTKQGSQPNEGFTVDQMVRYIIDLVDGVEIRRVDEQSYVAQQAAFKDPISHEDGIAELNRLEGCDWGTWGPDSPLDDSTDGQFDFTDREPETEHWFIHRRDCGEDIDLHSETSTLYGAVDVTYTDVAGVTRTVRREVDVPDLDGAGLTRVYPMNIGKSTQDVAEQMGDAFLAIWGQFAPARGSFSTSAPVRHHTRGELPPVYLRADGSNVRLGGILPSTSALALDSSPDRRTIFPIKRVTIDASGQVPVARVEVDQANDSLSVLQARQELASNLVG